jgi:hypothetical protein
VKERHSYLGLASLALFALALPLALLVELDTALYLFLAVIPFLLLDFEAFVFLFLGAKCPPFPSQI